jgi:3-hydroxybutyryl-CoA dehydrogenase
VIGGGTMGAGIAALLLLAGREVELVEASAELAVAAESRLVAILNDGVRRGKRSREDVAGALERIRLCVGIAEASPGPGVAIEAVPERAELKRAVLKAAEALEPLLLASNTSSLSIGELAAHLQRPELFIGMHFFNPVEAMALIEIVVADVTVASTVESAKEFAHGLGKEPVVVRDSPGFATSRLGVALGLEAIRMVQDGVADPVAIDTAMELGYRHPVGPLRLTDMVGLDVRLDIARHLEQVYGERFAPPQLLITMVREGRLGRKAGRGFYTWGEAE